MFIYTTKVRRGRLLVGVLALILACGLFTAVAGFHSLWSAPTVAATTPAAKVKTEADRVAYLEGLGWTVQPEALTCEELQVPKTFDATYDDYLALQTDQGFDLTRYAGKTLKRYTYAITNHPTGQEGLQASLLVYKNTVVGGEISAIDSGEILHGLAFPE